MGHLGLFQITKPTSSPLTSKDATATGVCFGTLGARRLKPKGTLCRVKWGKSSIKGHPYSPTLRFFPSSKAFNFTTYQLSNDQTSLLSPPLYTKQISTWVDAVALLAALAAAAELAKDADPAITKFPPLRDGYAHGLLCR